MKIKPLHYFAFIFALFLFACETDEETSSETETSNSIVGVWGLSELRFEESEENTELNLASEIIANLAADGCYLMALDFDTSGVVEATIKFDYLEINAGVTGLEIECPEESISESTNYTFNNGLLIFSQEGEIDETVNLTFEGNNTFLIQGSFVDEDNFGGGTLVFTRL